MFENIGAKQFWKNTLLEDRTVIDLFDRLVIIVSLPLCLSDYLHLQILDNLVLNARSLLGIVPITLLALFVRMVAASWTGLTTDEANGVIIAVTGSFGDMLAHLHADGNAPLFYIIIRGLNYIFGHQSWALKCLSIALATAFVPFFYWLFKPLLGRAICLSVSLLIALSPTTVAYETLIRPYGLMAVFGLLSTYCCMRVLSQGSDIRRAIAYGVSTTLLMYTHYWSAFIPIGHVGLVLIGICRGWFSRRAVFYWFGGAAMALLLFWPQMVSVFTICSGLKNDLSAFDVSPRPFSLLCDFFPFLLISKGRSTDFRNTCFLFIINFLVFLTVVAPRQMLVKRPALDGKGEETVYDGRMWKAATFCGLFAAFGVDFFLPSLRWRYMMAFVPMVFLVFVTGFNGLLAGRPVFYRIVLPCLVWACMFIPFLAKLPQEPDTTTDALVYKIVTSADHKKDAVMIAWEVIAPTINFSLPADIESVSYPHLGRTVINNWSDMTFRLHDPAILKQFLLKMESVLNRGGQVWLIDVSHSLRPLDYRKNDLIDNTPFIETTVRRSDQIRSWLLTHARQVGRTQLAPGRDFNIILTQFAPIDADAAHALLPKIETLWQTVYGEQNDPDQRFDGLTILDGHAAKSTPVP